MIHEGFPQGINRLSVNVLTDNGFLLTCFSIEIDALGKKD